MVEVNAERIDVSILAAAAAVAGGASLAVDVESSVFGIWIFLDVATSFLLYSGVTMTTTPEWNVATRERLVPAGPLASRRSPRPVAAPQMADGRENGECTVAPRSPAPRDDSAHESQRSCSPAPSWWG